MDSNNNGGTCEMRCGCGHHYVRPIAIILIGVAFLCQAFGWLSMQVVAVAWPILLIIAACTKLCKCCKK